MSTENEKTVSGAGGELAPYRKMQLAAGLDERDWPVERIKALYHSVAPEGATVAQVAALLTVCAAYDLNPWLKEVWLADIKNNGSLEVLTGRDAILKSAEKFDYYLGYYAQVVREGDEFEAVREGDRVDVTHVEKSWDGEIIGSYCVVHLDGRPDILLRLTKKEMQGYMNKDAYKKNPVDMWTKSAVLKAHRLAVRISGLYEPDEFLTEEESRELEGQEVADMTADKTSSLKERIAARRKAGAEDAQYEVVDEEEPEGDPSESQEEPQEAEGEEEPPEAEDQEAPEDVRPSDGDSGAQGQSLEQVLVRHPDWKANIEQAAEPLGDQRKNVNQSIHKRFRAMCNDHTQEREAVRFALHALADTPSIKMLSDDEARTLRNFLYHHEDEVYTWLEDLDWQAIESEVAGDEDEVEGEEG